ncbi:galactokinase [Massilia sp. PAMC28688]|uniref:galactokinase n=1 Tax=Massilia sp. PAMC28688 TaxID=2861283 RepID=UPI001C629823|nr:galactokinase [Massilia sp. PAMC28688]QYF93688.1 galactokinase [Massilia sp. PAMC28688]
MITFDKFFAGSTPVVASAPGRVNLLGEHTDYNDGFVLPIATPMRTTVAVAPSRDDAHYFYSEEMDDQVILPRRGRLASGYGRYIEGCIRVLEQLGHEIPPLRIFVRSSVPVGSGLSSSAALEVATLRALRTHLGLALDDVQIAQLARNAEVAYAGVQCGIMDQMASSLCDETHMLFLDTRSLDTRVLSLPAHAEVLVMDSGVARTLAGSKYNERRAECDAAAAALGASSLRDVTDVAALAQLEEPLRRRARHVITENARVVRAAEGVDAAQFGRLMNESHASLRDDYEVSIPELDTLCEMLRAAPGVYGARLTGAGFGGACVALCAPGSAAGAGALVLEQYNAAGHKGELLMPAATQHGGSL